MTGASPRETFSILPNGRVAVSATFGVAIGAVASFLLAWQVAVLAGWDAALALYVTWIWTTIGRYDAAATKRVATTLDLSHATAEVVLIAASLMNLVAVGLALVEATRQSTAAAGVINLATVLSVGLSWAAVHTVYTLRYARVYYEQGGGIAFDDGDPDYGDFAYVAFTIGMTYQVSDTTLTSRLFRRTALRHTLLSYLFGAVIGATVINVIAGLFRG